MTIAKMYGKAMSSLVNKEIDYDTDVVNCLLCTSTYTPNQDTHDYLDDITAELSGGGYARVALTSKTKTYDGASNTLTLDCADVVFSGLTAANIRYAVFYVVGGTPGTSPLLCYWDFESNLSATSTTFTCVIAPTGLITFVVA